MWFKEELGLDRLARLTERIDIYDGHARRREGQAAEPHRSGARRMTRITAAASRLMQLDDYVPILGVAGDRRSARARHAGSPGRTVQMVNSTAVGGGVAEILNRLVPLMQELGLVPRWDVITGGDDFFEITKAFHNALHGGPFEPRPQDFETFLAYTEQNRQRLHVRRRLHRHPRSAARRAHRRASGRPEPLDLALPHRPSRPNPRVWDFLRPFVCRYDGALFSSPEFSRQLPIPQYLFFPCIDPLSDKNRDLAA